jgi:hypothetical protein
MSLTKLFSLLFSQLFFSLLNFTFKSYPYIFTFNSLSLFPANIFQTQSKLIMRQTKILPYHYVHWLTQPGRFNTSFLNLTNSALCTLHSALCTLHSALCTLHSALCTLHSALCTLQRLTPLLYGKKVTNYFTFLHS